MSCKCAEKCDVKFKITLLAHSRCVKVEMRGKNHNSVDWKPSIKDIPLNPYVNDYISEGCKNNEKPSIVYKKIQQRRKEMNLPLEHGSFLIDLKKVTNRMCLKRFDYVYTSKRFRFQTKLYSTNSVI